LPKYNQFVKRNLKETWNNQNYRNIKYSV